MKNAANLQISNCLKHLLMIVHVLFLSSCSILSKSANLYYLIVVFIHSCLLAYCFLTLDVLK
jgi:hypothetical protein